MRKNVIRLLSLFLSLALLVSAPVFALENESADPAQLAQQLQTELEEKYACRIQFENVSDASGKIRVLEGIDEELQKIPAPLMEATTSAIRNQMGAFTLKYIYEGTLAGPFADNAFEYAPVHGLAHPTPYSASIELFNDTEPLVHEYGHLVNMSLLDAKYGAGVLEGMWTAQNGGVAYGNYDSDNPVFVTRYASTNYQEDFADTFMYIMGDGSLGLQLTYSHPNSTAVWKMTYLRQLLSEAFGVSVSDFPSTDPSQPSPWAEAGVQEYMDIFAITGIILADRSRPFRPGYQSGTTRRDFARAAYGNVVGKIYQDIFWGDDDIRDAFKEKWYKDDSKDTFDTMMANYDIPFTDVSGSVRTYWSFTNDKPILALYLNGVVNGTNADSTTFSPEATITRQEAATMLYRLCKALDYQFPRQGAAFADDGDIADWAREAVGAVAAAGIMNGVGDDLFDPEGLYTYEQSALTMVRVYKLLNGK